MFRITLNRNWILVTFQMYHLVSVTRKKVERLILYGGKAPIPSCDATTKLQSINGHLQDPFFCHTVLQILTFFIPVPFMHQTIPSDKPLLTGSKAISNLIGTYCLACLWKNGLGKGWGESWQNTVGRAGQKNLGIYR